jgi:lipoteichoic acid synthase
LTESEKSTQLPGSFKIAFKPLTNISLLPLFSLFILLNALKITLFNFYLIPAHQATLFMYRFSITILIVSAIYLVFWKIKKPVLFIVFYIVQLIYMFASLSYYLYFHSYLHILQSLMLFGEGVGAFAAFASPKSLDLLILLIDLPLFIFLLLNYKKTAMKLKNFKLQNNIIIVACIFTILITEGWHYLHSYSLFQLLKPTNISETLIVERYGTLANNLSDVLLFSDELPLINSLKYGKEVNSNIVTNSKQNFVVIQVESMDSNIVNTKYKDKYIMPYLQSLTNESVYYPYTLSYHMGGATSDCEFSTIDSIEPLTSFPAIKLNSYYYPNSYLKRLTDQAYTTVAFHGNIGSYFNRTMSFSKMGFQEFNDMTKMNLKDEGWGAPDHKVFNYALDRINSVKSPFLSYIITMTSHGPFTNAGYYYHNNEYDDITDVTVKDYFNSLSYVDQSIKDFVLSVRSMQKDTNILIYGDHTPNVNKDGLFKQASFIYENKYFEFVPIFILTPDKKVYKETKKVASFLDISPTILNASGVPFKIKSEGLDLLQDPSGNNTIPFKGSNYDREFLYSKIVENN